MANTAEASAFAYYGELDAILIAYYERRIADLASEQSESAKREMRRARKGRLSLWRLRNRVRNRKMT